MPDRITAGDSIVFFPDNLSGNDPSTGKRVVFTPDLYTLVLIFSSANGSNLSVTAETDSGSYKVTLSSAITSQFQGLVCWHSIIRDVNNAEITFNNGRIEVAADPRTNLSGEDGRSIAEKQLEAVEKTILARANGTDVEEYYIGTRRVRNMTLQDLMALRNELRTTVARERAIAKGVNPSTAYVAFRQPGVNSLGSGGESWF